MTAPHYTSEPPTEVRKFYWIRTIDGVERISQYYVIGDTSFIDGITLDVAIMRGYQFAGPIPRPEEP